MCGLAQSKTAVDSTRLWFRHRRNSRSASVHQCVLAEQQFCIYLLLQLFVSVYETKWLNVSCLHSFPKWCLLSLNWAGTTHMFLPFREAQEVESYSAACVHFCLSRPFASMLTWDITLWQKTENRFAEIAGLAIVIPSQDFNSVGTKGCFAKWNTLAPCRLEIWLVDVCSLFRYHKQFLWQPVCTFHTKLQFWNFHKYLCKNP